VRSVPIGGVVADLVDEQAFASLAGDFASYVARKIGNKDEVRLVLEPLEVLTPLFLDDLRQAAEKKPLVLFFDTYERTCAFLDAWLRDVLEGRYGEVAANILLVIAGREELDRNLWAAYESLLARLRLEPFSEQEARDYLTRQGITNERIVEVILNLSGRLPLLLSMLAAARPTDPGQVDDPSDEAVARFLKWVDEPEQRQVALDAALPRRLNRDVLAVLTGEKTADALFGWLQGMPFLQKREAGWAYHEVVRTQMLRYKRQQSPKGWADLHNRLAEYYERLRDELGLDEKNAPRDETWQGYTLEALYHRLCAAAQRHLAEALNGFVDAWDVSADFARRWATTLRQAGSESDAPSLEGWGERLEAGLEAYRNHDHPQALAFLDVLLEEGHLKEKQRASILGRRGLTCLLMGEYDQALADFNRAIELDPNYVWAIASRGVVYGQMGKYDQALADFNRAIELDPNWPGPSPSRGVTYPSPDGEIRPCAGGFQPRHRTRPQLAWAIALRGETYRQMGKYEDALADFNRAIELDPNYAWAIARRGETYRRMGKYEDALADFNRAIELDPNCAWAIASRGQTYHQMGKYEDALADFNRAIELDPNLDWAIALRGETYRLMGKYEDALADFNRAIELDPNDAWAIASRGQTYRLMGKYEDALADFNRAIELDPNEAAYYMGKASAMLAISRDPQKAIQVLETASARFPENQELQLMLFSMRAIAGQIQDLTELSRFLSLLSERLLHATPAELQMMVQFAQQLGLPGVEDLTPARLLLPLAESYKMQGNYQEALAVYQRAIELAPNDAWAIASRGQTYHQMGKYEDALADFNRAIELDPNYAWAIASRGETYRQMGNTRMRWRISTAPSNSTRIWPGPSPVVARPIVGWENTRMRWRISTAPSNSTRTTPGPLPVAARPIVRWENTRMRWRISTAPSNSTRTTPGPLPVAARPIVGWEIRGCAGGFQPRHRTRPERRLGHCQSWRDLSSDGKIRGCAGGFQPRHRTRPDRLGSLQSCAPLQDNGSGQAGRGGSCRGDSART
jgi:tetratricopeptide (TPR) repeat protein